MGQRRIRVLIAKVGLDGHERGAKLVARTLRDSGMEVVYTGIRQSVEQVVNAVVQEDVDVLGLSFLAGDHMVLLPKVIKGLKESGKEDIMVLVGGILPKRDIEKLKREGVDEVFLPGTRSKEIVAYIKNNINKK
ncbi:MAG: cobalamin B12-binding domain-containing protein [Deltaproteobacteria bacterium]|nr:cobalamin B12-binding domain-containing protein [Deltaproteobacteria bacterium]